MQRFTGILGHRDWLPAANFPLQPLPWLTNTNTNADPKRKNLKKDFKK